MNQISVYNVEQVLNNITQVQYYTRGVWCQKVPEIFYQESGCAMDAATELKRQSWGLNLTCVDMPSVCEQ